MGKQKSGDQTEKPTPKKLRDARKEGEVSKSKELSKTVLVLAWLLMAWLITPLVGNRIGALFDQTFIAIGSRDPHTMLAMLQSAGLTLAWLTVPFLLAAAVMAILVEFLQVGALFVPKRVKPKLERLDPSENIARMFSTENLVELAKSVFKTAAIVGILVLVLKPMMPDLLKLPYATPDALAHAHWKGLMWIGIWIIFVFFFVSALDVAYQKTVFIKNLKMSQRDIRQEHKDSEGDPLVKSRRKQLAQEWQQQNMLHAVRGASVIVTNPTHIAVALLYDPGETELPVVVAKGEDYEASLIREAAEQAGVPIMQNIELARGLNEKVEVDQYVSSEFFEAVAELLFWAENIRKERGR